MGNLEQEMKLLAVTLTGQEADNIPDSLEDICHFIAENYKAPAEVPFEQVTAPADAAAENPTKAEFDGLIAKLKEAKIFK